MPSERVPSESEPAASVFVEATDVSVVFSPAMIGRRALFDRLTGDRTREAAITALDGVSLSCAPGDTLGIIGRNGAGKTTLLRVLSGILPPTAGDLRLAGDVVALLDLGAGLEEQLTGLQNVQLLAELLNLPRSARPAYIAHVREFSELGEALDRPVRTYSSGMKLRLLFSIRTYRSAEVLIMDEIIGVGDHWFLEKAAARMAELVEHSAILIIASHDFSMLERFCASAVLLEEGRVMTMGPIEEVKARYLSEGGPN